MAQICIIYLGVSIYFNQIFITLPGDMLSDTQPGPRLHQDKRLQAILVLVVVQFG